MSGRRANTRRNMSGGPTTRSRTLRSNATGAGDPTPANLPPANPNGVPALLAATLAYAPGLLTNQNIGRIAATSKYSEYRAAPQLLQKFKVYPELQNYYETRMKLRKLREKMQRLKVGGEAHTRDSKIVAQMELALARFPARLEAALQYPDVAAQLNQHHPHVYEKRTVHRTPLLLAIEHGDEPIVRILLAAGADPTMPDRGDYGIITTPIFKAVGSSVASIGVINALLEAGADINEIGTKYGEYQTPLDAFHTVCGYLQKNLVETYGLNHIGRFLRSKGAVTYNELQKWQASAAAAGSA